MIFDVKQCGHCKARLVAGGHVVQSCGINPRSTVVKGISVCLLDLIAHHDGLTTLCGDIGNALSLPQLWRKCGQELDWSLVTRLMLS